MDVQSYTLDGQSVDFKTVTLAEFIRFRSLAGESTILEDLLCSLEADDIFYDVGANVGTYICFVASKLGPRRTVAFELEPQNARNLRATLELNGFDAEIVEVTLSNVSGTVDFALSGDELPETDQTIATDQETATIEVVTDRGDEVIENFLLSWLYVKIDVVGTHFLD